MVPEIIDIHRLEPAQNFLQMKVDKHCLNRIMCCHKLSIEDQTRLNLRLNIEITLSVNR